MSQIQHIAREKSAKGTRGHGKGQSETEELKRRQEGNADGIQNAMSATSDSRALARAQGGWSASAAWVDTMELIIAVRKQHRSLLHDPKYDVPWRVSAASSYATKSTQMTGKG